MKLKYNILKKLKNISSREFDLLLLVARYQDEHGIAAGIYYKDICQETGMCKQSFYNALNKLSSRGIITYQKMTDSDYDIQILQNDFSRGEADYKEGYIMLNRKLFRSKKFKSLKAREKYLLLELMKITHSNKGIFRIGKDKFYRKYEEELGVSMRVIRYYLHNLKEYFQVGLKRGMYTIKYIAWKFQEDSEAATDQYRNHTARYLLRRSGYNAANKDAVHELNILMNQYVRKAAEKRLDIRALLYQILQKAREENGMAFKPKLVHMLLKECLN